MKVLIIALDAPIREALEAQLDVRGRVYHAADIEWISAADTDKNTPALSIPDDVGVVVNIATLELFQQGLADEDLQRLRDIVQACQGADTPLIQLSGCQVFDGTESGRHREAEEPLTESRFGEQLVAMENLLQDNLERYIVLRTGPLFSELGDNLLTRLLPCFNQVEPIRLSKNGKCCPLHVGDLARVVSAIIDQLSCGCEAWGVYHYSSTEPVSRYQFAETVLAVVSQYSDASEHLQTLEPLDAVDSEWKKPLLNCEKILETFG